MTEENESRTEKKIIIDEDWKSQVRTEKQQPVVSQPIHDESPPRQVPVPPASLSFLFSTIATQAFITLGLIAHPVTQKVAADLEQAKHFIDMLGVLEEKTTGNLTAEEKQQLDSLLYELRMQYVQATLNCA